MPAASVADRVAAGLSSNRGKARLSRCGGCKGVGEAVDILVNNAGIGPGAIRPDSWQRPVKFWEITADQWRRFVAVHTTAPLALTNAVVPEMMREGWGRIVNVTTSLGTMLNAGSPTYGPSKAALEALSAIMAKDLDGTGVTVNVLVPGGITNTPMVSEIGLRSHQNDPARGHGIAVAMAGLRCRCQRNGSTGFSESIGIRRYRPSKRRIRLGRLCGLDEHCHHADYARPLLAPNTWRYRSIMKINGRCHENGGERAAYRIGSRDGSALLPPSSLPARDRDIGS